MGLAAAKLCRAEICRSRRIERTCALGLAVLVHVQERRAVCQEKVVNGNSHQLDGSQVRFEIWKRLRYRAVD